MVPERCPRLPSSFLLLLENLFPLRCQISGKTWQGRTDDSYQFARATKRLRQAIEALGDATAGGSGDGSTEDDGPVDGSGLGGDNGNGGVEMALSLERKQALVEIMKEVFKSYHLAWARSSIEPTFKVRGVLLSAIERF